MYQNYILIIWTLVDIHTNEKKAYLWKELSLFPGVPEIAAAFKRRMERRFSAVQCTGAFTPHREISLLGLTKYFDGILLSSDAGVKKPDPAFLRCC